MHRLTLLLFTLAGCGGGSEPLVVVQELRSPVHSGLPPADWTPIAHRSLGVASFRTRADQALVLEHTEVRAAVSAGLAVVTVEQQFHNPFDHTIDATYILPLPPDAAVRGFTLTCGTRVIEGRIRDKQTARTEYERARRNGQKAALLEQQRENLFIQEVASICPDEEVAVSVEYIQQVKREDGHATLVFPTTVGERYDAPADLKLPNHTPAPTRSGRDVAITVTIDESLPVQSLWSDTHAIEIEDGADYAATVRLDPSDAVPNKDFALRWTFAADSPRAAVVVQPPVGREAGYIALTLEPQVLVDLERQRKRELLFVMDSSCSMSGVPWDTSVATVEKAMEQMAPDDTFNLVLYSSGATSLFSEPMPATKRNIRLARAWLGRAFQGGGTNLDSGILASLQMPGDPEALRLMLLLTDGYIGSERQIVELVDENLGEARIFALGVGSSVNRMLLENLAEAGRGVVDYQLPNTPIDETVDAFYARIAHPAMTDITLDFGGLDVWDVYPSRVPDLWSGQPLQVVARYRGTGQGTVSIEGRANREDYRLTLPVDLGAGEENEAVQSLWARRAIHDRTYDLELRAEERQALIQAVALEHHLVSDYTSLVAVERTPSACGTGRAFDIAHYGPVGTRMDAPMAGPSPRGRPMPSPRPAHAPAASTPPPAPWHTMRAPEPQPSPSPSPAADTGLAPQLASFAVTGAVDESAARNLILRRLSHLARCLGGSATATATLTIDAKGAVTAVRFSGAVLDTATQTCLETALRRIQFAENQAGTVRFGLGQT